MLPALSILEFRSFCESFWLLSQNCMSQVFSCCPVPKCACKCLLSAFLQVLGAKIDDEPPVEDECGHPETSWDLRWIRWRNFVKCFFQWNICHLLGQPRWPPQHGLHELQPEPREPREPRYVVFANVSQLPLKEVLHKLQLQLQRFFWPVFLIFSFFFRPKWLKAERRHRRPRRRPFGQRQFRVFRGFCNFQVAPESAREAWDPPKRPEVSVFFFTETDDTCVFTSDYCVDKMSRTTHDAKTQDDTTGCSAWQ